LLFGVVDLVLDGLHVSGYRGLVGLPIAGLRRWRLAGDSTRVGLSERLDAPTATVSLTGWGVVVPGAHW
jgi:hypothetical protein